ncbi:MAG: uroporphyrinogen decarboxylase family protein [Kiritimatiellales bacterium]
MTSKERVRCAVGHKQPDRIPVNFEAMVYVKDKIVREHGLSGHEDIYELYEVDIRDCSPDYVGPELKRQIENGRVICETVYGCKMVECQSGGETHSVVCEYPFNEKTTVQDILNYDWINPDWFDYESVKCKCARYKDKALQFGHEGPFQLSTFLMSMETLFEKMILEPDVAHALYNRFVQFELEYYERILVAGDGQIDILRPHDDYGTQQGLLFSVPMWEEYFLENTRKLAELAHRYGAFYQQHSCGAVREIIPSLIKAGADILEPLQKVKGMEIEKLKHDFGAQICFHGGIDTQFVLPHSTPEQIEEETRHYIDVLGKGGGYILMASQCFESDVPVKNIDAIYRTARN